MADAMNIRDMAVAFLRAHDGTPEGLEPFEGDVLRLVALLDTLRAQGAFEERRLVAEWLREYGGYAPAYSGNTLAERIERCRHHDDVELRRAANALPRKDGGR